MDAATELIWEMSYNAVTVDAICARAGVKKGSFYYFFESKAALALAAMEHAWQSRTRPHMEAIFASSIPPLERLKRYFDGIYQHELDAKSHGRVLGCPYFSVGMESGALDPEVWHASQNYVKRKHKYLAQAVHEAHAQGLLGVDDVEDALQGIQTLIEGAVARTRVQDDPEPLRCVYEQALRLLGVQKVVA
jgi:TetR/AcrR family transcriptional repressor of nem operon